MDVLAPMCKDPDLAFDSLIAYVGRSSRAWYGRYTDSQSLQIRFS